MPKTVAYRYLRCGETAFFAIVTRPRWAPGRDGASSFYVANAGQLVRIAQNKFMICFIKGPPLRRLIWWHAKTESPRLRQGYNDPICQLVGFEIASGHLWRVLLGLCG